MTYAVALLALYGAGLSASLSPCVLPLVPGYLGVLVAPVTTRRARFGRVVVFAAGVVTTFVILGGALTLAGRGVSRAVGSLERVAGFGLIVLAALLSIGLLGRVGGHARIVNTLPVQPHARALLLGIGCAAAWSPCVGPLLGAALTAAAGSGSLWRASLLLLAYGCGVLSPFCALALVKVPRIGHRLRALGRVAQPISAVLILAIGVLLLAGWYDALVQRLPIGT